VYHLNAHRHGIVEAVALKPRLYRAGRSGRHLSWPTTLKALKQLLTSQLELGLRHALSMP
jgi:hypothetical protein